MSTAVVGATTPAVAVPAKKKNIWAPIVSGCISGGVEAVSVWPMEFMKTQLQLFEKLPGGQKPPFTGTIDGLRYTVNNTGFLSLYRGLAPTLAGSIPKAGIRFGANDVCKDLLRDENGKLSPGKNFLAGVGAGTAEAIFAVTPIETIKTKLIQNNMPFIAGVKDIVRREGPAGLYQGVVSTILKQSSNQGLRFMFFNEYKRIATDDGKTKLSPVGSLLGGMMAGTFSTLGNNPFDVVKTRMQGNDAKKYSSTVDCFRQIMKNEGVSGFYRGIVPRMGRVIPGQGIIFLTFDSIEGSVAKFLG